MRSRNVGEITYVLEKFSRGAKVPNKHNGVHFDTEIQLRIINNYVIYCTVSVDPKDEINSTIYSILAQYKENIAGKYLI